MPTIKTKHPKKFALGKATASEILAALKVTKTDMAHARAAIRAVENAGNSGSRKRGSGNRPRTGLRQAAKERQASKARAATK